MYNFLKTIDIWGIGLLFVRFMDGFKYHLESNAIRRIRVAKGRSRKFINIAWSADAYMIAYLIHHGIDWYLMISFIIALFFVTEYWLVLYYNYPYKYRNLINWKRPNIFIYLLNSILPNSMRKKL